MNAATKAARAARFPQDPPVSSGSSSQQPTTPKGSVLSRLGPSNKANGRGGADPSPARITPANRVKGRSKALDKPYLRLTGLPDLATIRPEKVLRDSLQHVLLQYAKHADYSYACEQLKSIRQDLTVQSCKGQFCVHVYEVHARLAMGHADLEEYNQCASRLQEMRAKGATASVAAFDEFGGYRVLYALHVENALELARTMGEVATGRQARTQRLKLHPPQFPVTDLAMRVVSAWRSHNTRQFRQCVQHAWEHKAPSLVLPADEEKGGRAGAGRTAGESTCTQQACFLLDALLAKQRVSCLQRVLKAFDSVTLSHLYAQLGFDTETREGQECALQFLRDQKVAPQFVRLEGQEQPFLDCRAAMAATAAAAPAVTGKKRTRGEEDVGADDDDDDDDRPVSKKQKRCLIKLQKQENVQLRLAKGKSKGKSKGKGGGKGLQTSR